MDEHRSDNRAANALGGHGAIPSGSKIADPRVTDPVCGMKVDPATSKHRFDHGGTIFHFCSAGCQTKFAANPAAYLQPAPPEPGKPGAIYTCPMHPQIRQNGPGNCPICGMALEPETVTASDEPNAELADMSRRFWIGLVLALPVLVLEMGSHIPGLAMHSLVPPGISLWI